MRLNHPLDSQVVNGADMNAATETECVALADCSARSLGSTVDFRYGRLDTQNAFGPETQALAVDLKASSWNGTAFTVDTDDDFSGYAAADATLINYTGGLPAQTVTGPFTSTCLTDGRTIPNDGLQLSIPGAGITGTVDITLNVPAWLEFPWSGAADTDPTGTVTFGRFRGHDRVVYWRKLAN